MDYVVQMTKVGQKSEVSTHVAEIFGESYDYFLTSWNWFPYTFQTNSKWIKDSLKIQWGLLG